jgi:hypothetical protein
MLGESARDAVKPCGIHTGQYTSIQFSAGVLAIVHLEHKLYAGTEVFGARVDSLVHLLNPININHIRTNLNITLKIPMPLGLIRRIHHLFVARTTSNGIRSHLQHNWKHEI